VDTPRGYDSKNEYDFWEFPQKKNREFYSYYPLELLPPQSDFQGKKFLKKNFHPFSGLDGGSSQQTVEVRNIFIGA
jgi:hypothetical protein